MELLRQELNKSTIVELKAMARMLKIRGYSRLNKNDLIDVLLTYDNQVVFKYIKPSFYQKYKNAIITALGIIFGLIGLIFGIIPYLPFSHPKIAIAWYNVNNKQLVICPLDSVVVVVTEKEMSEGIIRIPVNLAIRNDEKKDLELTRIELSFPPNTNINSTANPKIDPQNSIFIYEHLLGTISNSNFFTPINTVDTINLPRKFRVIPVLAKSQDGCPLYIVTLLNYSGFFQDTTIVFNIRVFCKNYKSVGTQARLHFKADLKIINGFPQGEKEKIVVEDLIITKKCNWKGWVNLYSWKGIYEDDGTTIEFIEDSASYIKVQYVLIDNILRRINVSKSKSNFLDYSLFDTNNDGIADLKIRATENEFMIRWDPKTLKK